MGFFLVELFLYAAHAGIQILLDAECTSIYRIIFRAENYDSNHSAF